MQIKTQDELNALCQRARQAGCFGLDSEFIPENSYYPELALIQIAVDEQCYIIDPLSALDLSPLENIICAEEVIVVVHAGAQDMGIFYHRTRKPPKNVFDTQIAASFIGMGHQVSYASLVQQLFGIPLKKGQSYTNWLKRPLKPEQLQYALEDVEYLLPAYEKMIATLEAANRLSWVADELTHYEDADFYTAHEAHPEKRIKKTGQMHGRDQAVLEALAAFREDEAKSRNLPRKKILSDYTLVDLARRRPTSPGELLSLRSADHLTKRYAKDLIRIITESNASPLPERPRQSYGSLTDNQTLVVEFLSFCLKAFCLKEQLASVMLSTRAELEYLVTDYFGDDFSEHRHRLLRGWRKDAVGNSILQCLKGELTARYNPDKQQLVFSVVE
ncbi:MAG: ribonuclease D [Deltaproteobacteria bacterium]|nr:ribonuclease D [Deltaproteobacteria bacterium]